MANLPDLFRSNRSLFSDLFRELDDLFTMNRSLIGGQPLGPSLGSGENFLQVSSDFEESDKEYLLSFDLPGVKQEDIKIDVSQNVLTVSGERKQEYHEGQTSGRRFGKFQRSLTLPSGVGADQIRAHYDNGVLEIVIPKPQEAQARSIQVQGGRAERAIPSGQARASGAQAGSAQASRSSKQVNVEKETNPRH